MGAGYGAGIRAPRSRESRFLLAGHPSVPSQLDPVFTGKWESGRGKKTLQRPGPCRVGKDGSRI